MKHNWTNQRIGHNDFGDVCSVCNALRGCGINEDSCPEWLYDFYWFNGKKHIFDFPSTIEEKYTQTYIKYINQKENPDLIDQFIQNSFGRKEEKGYFELIVNGEVLDRRDHHYTFSDDISPLRMVSINDRVDYIKNNDSLFLSFLEKDNNDKTV